MQTQHLSFLSLTIRRLRLVSVREVILHAKFKWECATLSPQKTKKENLVTHTLILNQVVTKKNDTE